MTAIRATRTPAGGPATGGQQPTIRYAANPMWPGITSEHDARCSCTWAVKDGVMQVKFANAMCGNHPRAVSGG